LEKLFPQDQNGGRSDDHSYLILKSYLDGKPIEVGVRIGKLPYDVTVTADAFNDNIGSYTSPDGRNIVVDSYDYGRDQSTFGHESAHAYMRYYYKRFPPFDYGPDGSHYQNEITTPSTAWLEGYAEYWGSRVGNGQEHLLCASDHSLHGQNLSLKNEDPWWEQFLDRLFQQKNKSYDNYKYVDWERVNKASALFSSEAVVSYILRDIAANLPDGAALIEENIQKGYAGDFEEFIKRWVKDRPGDALAIAKIVDINTNFILSEEEIKDLFGGTVDERASYKATYQGNNTCDAVEDINNRGGFYIVDPSEPACGPKYIAYREAQYVLKGISEGDPKRSAADAEVKEKETAWVSCHEENKSMPKPLPNLPSPVGVPNLPTIMNGAQPVEGGAGLR
jgi:hypothetical protein